MEGHLGTMKDCQELLYKGGVCNQMNSNTAEGKHTEMEHLSSYGSFSLAIYQWIKFHLYSLFNWSASFCRLFPLIYTSTSCRNS